MRAFSFLNKNKTNNFRQSYSDLPTPKIGIIGSGSMGIDYSIAVAIEKMIVKIALTVRVIFSKIAIAYFKSIKRQIFLKIGSQFRSCKNYFSYYK